MDLALNSTSDPYLWIFDLACNTKIFPLVENKKNYNNWYSDRTEEYHMKDNSAARRLFKNVLSQLTLL